MTKSLRFWWPAWVFVLLVTAFTSPSLSPDAVEMGVVGQSLWSGPVDGLDWHHYPPIGPVLYGLLALFLPLPMALAGLSILAATGLFLVLVYGLEGRGPRKEGVFVLLALFFSSDALVRTATEADVRGLQLLLLFSGIFIVAREGSPSRQQRLILGAIAGGLVLCRPEGILFAGLLALSALKAWRGRSVLSGIVALCIVVPYLGWVSLETGTWTLSSRAWELKGAGLLELLPTRPLIQLWGAGAETTDFRQVLSALPAQGSVPLEGPFAALSAAGRAIVFSMPIWSWLFVVIGMMRLWSQQRFLSVLFGGVVGICVALYWVPMGRDSALPLINLLPAVVCFLFFSVLGLLSATAWLGVRYGDWTKWILWLGLGSWSLGSGWIRTDASLEDALFSEASSWMDVHASGQTVASSFGSSRAVRVAKDVEWARIPSRWERRSLWADPKDSPDWLLLSHVDGLWALGPPVLGRAEPRAFFRNRLGWIVLLRIDPPPPISLGGGSGTIQADESSLVVEGLDGVEATD